MAAPVFSPGFIFSKSDAIALVVGLYVSADTATVLPSIGIAVAVVIAHFFLFCNILRMSRSLELIWSSIFVLLAGFTKLTGSPPWAITLVVSFAAAIWLALVEIRKPSYHGVFWRQINPNLPQWWRDSNQLGSARTGVMQES